MERALRSAHGSEAKAEKAVTRGLRQIGSYRTSLDIAVQAQKQWIGAEGRVFEARGNLVSGAWAGAGGLWVTRIYCEAPLDLLEVRNFSWNLTFFEWKRLLHNAVDRTPENAPMWFQHHLEWLRSRASQLGECSW